MSFEEEAPKKEGYLNKRSNGWPVSMALRYIKIEKHFLSFYPSYDELDKCRGLMRLKDATVNYYEDSNGYCFIVKEDSKKEDPQEFIFSAESEEERENWMYFLEKSISYANVAEFDEEPPIEVQKELSDKKRLSQFFGRKSVKYEDKEPEKKSEPEIRRLSQFLRRSLKLDKLETTSNGSSHNAQPSTGSRTDQLESFSDLQKMIEQQDALENANKSPKLKIKSAKAHSKKSNTSDKNVQQFENTANRKSFSFSNYFKKKEHITSPKQTGSLTGEFSPTIKYLSKELSFEDEMTVDYKSIQEVEKKRKSLIASLFHKK